MEVNIEIFPRDLKFKLTGEKTKIEGRGVDGFLVILQKYGKIIDRVNLSGQSNSYTFSRQVYLLVNMIKFLTDSVVVVGGKKINKGAFLLPEYRVNKDIKKGK